MPLSYHLIDYAIIALLIVVSRLVHPIFYICLIIVIIYVVRQHRLEAVIMIIIMAALINRPVKTVEIPERLTGRITSFTSNAIIMKTNYGLIKGYTDESFLYGDAIDVSIVQLDMNTPANTYGFNETHYLLSRQIVAKVKIVKIYSVTPHFHFANVLES